MLACVDPVRGVLCGHVRQVCVVGVGVEGMDMSVLGSRGGCERRGLSAWR